MSRSNYLYGLFDALQVNADHSAGVAGRSVAGRGGSVLGGGRAVRGAQASARGEGGRRAGGLLLLEEDLAHLFEEGGVHVLSLRRGVAGGDRGVAAPASREPPAEAAAGEAAAAGVAAATAARSVVTVT